MGVSGATGITVFAPDGYAKTFTIEQVNLEYPKGIYYTGLDDAIDEVDGGPSMNPVKSIQPGDGAGREVSDRVGRDIV